MASVTLKGTGGVDTRDFKKFAKALRKTAPEISARLRANLRAAGEHIASIARQKASWSSTIPGSVKARSSGATTSVIAGGTADTRHAAPYEFGSKGNRGEVRHPLFGDFDKWYSSPTRPFLRPAVKEGAPAAQAAAVNALDLAVREVVEATKG